MTPKERVEVVLKEADRFSQGESPMSRLKHEMEHQIGEAVNDALGKAARLVETGCLCRTCGRVIDIIPFDDICRKYDAGCETETVSGDQLAKEIRGMKV